MPRKPKTLQTKPLKPKAPEEHYAAVPHDGAACYSRALASVMAFALGKRCRVVRLVEHEMTSEEIAKRMEPNQKARG